MSGYVCGWYVDKKSKRRFRGEDVVGVECRVQVPLRELQLELIVADGEIPVEEEHAFHPASPARAQRLPFLLVP